MIDFVLSCGLVLMITAVFWYTHRGVHHFFNSYDAQNTIRTRLLTVHKNKESKEEHNFVFKILEKYNVLDYFRNINEEKIKNLKTWLQKAGMRSPNSVAYYFLTKITLCSLAFFGSLFATIGFNLIDNALLQILAPLGITYLMYMLVDAHIQSNIQDRYKDVQKGIPDALDLMVICTEAGMSIDHALRRISIELEAAHHVLCEELKVTVVELGIASNRTKVFENLIARVDVPQIHAIVNSIVQSSEFGTPISVTLQTLAEEYRKERMLVAESKASRLPALMTLPMMLFILPTLFIVLIGPVMIRAMAS